MTMTTAALNCKHDPLQPWCCLLLLLLCRPDIQLGKYGHQQETPKETLVREALEYQELYHRDKGTAPVAKQARMQQVLAEIESTGTYTHTFDELEHGARVAWR